jgi:hypothetical protein
MGYWNPLLKRSYGCAQGGVRISGYERDLWPILMELLGDFF